MILQNKFPLLNKTLNEVTRLLLTGREITTFINYPTMDLIYQSTKKVTDKTNYRDPKIHLLINLKGLCHTRRKEAININMQK